ncbi:cupin domain-containing protein [Halomarina halobia]|uniref:Cupin domain-containing protein n=1 Tax=Halomarina halobia TaxID=3033386 RepID=A0ABD6A8N5_9EURY|nr:cupin domain-containing protein [Halomarina sp. PSR21]
MDHVSENDRNLTEVAEGVYLADLAGSERASMKFWRVEPGATLPSHRHHNEQIGFVISGTLTAILEDGKRPLEPGDSYAFSSEELHGAENRGDEPAVGIGVLSPPRDEPRWATKRPERTPPAGPND